MKTVAIGPEPLSTLLDAIKKGEEVMLTSENKPVAKVTPVPNPPAKRPHPQPGCLKGTFIMAPDFDEPLEAFKEYME
jgi:antitoxin (DNA-binding transcriptional repressor) of toxin-antitoxin stability system